MRTIAVLLLTIATFPLYAKWEACPSTCVPPTGTVSGLSSLPLYSGQVRFKEEQTVASGVFWLWVRVDPPNPCTPAQLVNLDDRLFGCGAKVGEVLLRTGRVRVAK